MADLSSILGSAGIGGQIGQAIVRLELDTAKYQAEMKAAQAQTTTGANSMSAGLAKFGGIAKAGLGVAALGVVAFGVKAVSAASALGEAVNKSNVIFGNNAREIETWAETGADAFGLSKTAALDAAGGFGAMLQTAGLAVGESADMSKALVQLAGDMASFNNIDPTEALEKLRSGLAGEAEPLRRFGVFLSEAAIQQEAYRSGLAKVGEELTEAQKVQARFNVIFAQTTKQQGDFQRTADSLPNVLRSMRAEFENVAAEVGTALLPVAQALLGALRNLIPVIKVVADNIGLIAGALAGFAAFRYLPGLLFSIASGLEAIGAASLANGVLNVAAALSSAASAAGGFVAAAAAIPVIGYKIVQAIEPVPPAMQALNERMKEFGVVRGPAMEAAADRLAARLAGDEASMQAKAGLAEQGILNLGGATAETRKQFERTGDAVEDFAGMTGDELKDWRLKTKAAFETAIFALEDLTTESAITTEDVKTGFRVMRDEARDLSRAMNRLKEERWINDEFQVFLSEQGPEWLIGFANANEREQRRMQRQWEESQTVFNRSLKGSFLDLNGALDELDKKTTQHTVLVRYKYVGFDPTKPGMQSSGRSLIGGPQP